MARSRRIRQSLAVIAMSVPVALLGGISTVRGDVTSEDVERAIRAGVHFLRDRQLADGSWPELQGGRTIGTTSLVTLALLTAGEKPESPAIQRALALLRQVRPTELDSTYAIGLQTMVFAAAEPERDRLRILANVEWLEHAQSRQFGTWSYTARRSGLGDNSNSQYALLGLNAASEVGLTVGAEVLARSRIYYEQTQLRDGGWGYTLGQKQSTGSMTCAGISSLIISGARRFEEQEFLRGETVHGCGKGAFNPHVARAIDWLGSHFQVTQNFGHGSLWKYYYLYGLERAGRLTGVRFFGRHDWYRKGAEELVSNQNRFMGCWRGVGAENDFVATSFALLFLAKGRAPVLINKLYHAPVGDWDNDPDDVRNLVAIVSRDWQSLLTWQVVDPSVASVRDLLQAPIVFLNGHRSPELTAGARQNLRAFVEQGGCILADACCTTREFDVGFRRMVKEIFPEEEFQLRRLSPDHPIWRAKHVLNPAIYELWGIEHGCRTVLIYSPRDLSCYWNQSQSEPRNSAVTKAVHLGQNIIDYVTGREMPADKLVVRDLHEFRADAPKRGALRIAKLKHAGDWNIAPQAIPNLMDILSRPPLSFNVVITQKELLARDPSLVYYPLIYIHGRGALSFEKEDLAALRRHLEPGGGTLFADAACGSPAFDAAFRRLVALLLPNNPLVPIPHNDPLLTTKVGFDLADCKYTSAAGGGRDFPQLEGVDLGGHWAIIYSKYDIGCALERHTGIECKGYVHESAAKIAANIVIYSTLP